MRKAMLWFLVLLAGGYYVLAREYKGVTMPDRIMAGERSLVLNGMALRKKMIFKVYVAGLYLTGECRDAEKILQADSPMRMVMHFLRKVGREKINDAWIEGLQANTPDAGEDLQRDFSTLCGYMKDVRDGDRIVFTYVPGTGTEVAVGQEVQGVIPGREFAVALFSCWIGPSPGPGEDFKQALLGLPR